MDRTRWLDWAKWRYRLSAKQSRQRRFDPPGRTEARLDSSRSSEPGIESIKAVETGIVTGRELPFNRQSHSPRHSSDPGTP